MKFLFDLLLLDLNSTATSGPRAKFGPRSTLMWPASYNFIILDSYFNIENMLKIQKKYLISDKKIALNLYLFYAFGT